MIRKQQKRAARGKQTAFRVGGQEVDSKRIARFVRRYGPQWDNRPRDDHRQASSEPGKLGILSRTWSSYQLFILKLQIPRLT